MSLKQQIKYSRVGRVLTLPAVYGGVRRSGARRGALIFRDDGGRGNGVCESDMSHRVC